MKKYSFIIFFLIFIWVALFSPVIAVDPVTTIAPEPTTTSEPTTDPNAFVIPPFPTLEIPSPVKSCELKTSRDETIYPPNSACYAEVKRTQKKITDYPKTCIKEPYVSYSDIRGVDHNRVPEGDNSWATCEGVNSVKDPPCNVYITVTTDVSKAELGSYGPNYETLATATSSADIIAQKYLFNAVFDRPYYSMSETPREAWRTYWRLLPFNEQANLTAQFIKLVFLNQQDDLKTLKKINNTQYQYIDSSGGIHTTTVKDVANRLPPCLKSEPVCPDFAKAYNDLSADTKAAYDTLIPLSFNNLRGWIALAPPSFPPRDGVPQTVSRESLPYIEPIFQGLLSSKYGLLSNLQPSWLIATTLTDLTDTNTGYTLSGKDNYISGQFDPVKQLFKDGGSDGPESSLDPIVLDNADIVRCPDYPDVYHLSAPYTYPKNPQNKDPFHIQEVQILGSTLDWELDHPDPIKTCAHETGCDENGNNCSGCDRWSYSCNSPAEICADTSIGGSNEECCQFKVTGSGVGKALTVFNNPKVTDIKETVVMKDTSLYNTLIPMAFLTPTPTDMKIDAPVSTHMEINTDYSGSGAVSNITNPIFRENNLAQDTMHLIQNCWLVPSANQKSSKCGKPEPIFCGPTDLPDLNVGDSACKVKNNTLNLPESLIQAIEKAAETFKVPPSLIIGLFYGEGVFNPGSNYLNEAFVTENLQSCAVLPNCDPNSQTINNIVPIDKSYWDASKGAVNVLDPTRVPGACNLLDGIFAWAQTISRLQNGSGAFAGKTCFGIALNAGSGGSNSCNWDINDVETAIRVWEFGTSYNATYGCATRENSCLLGGGGAANCASGGDTCETKDNRYAQPSHNACVFDIYQSN